MKGSGKDEGKWKGWGKDGERNNRDKKETDCKLILLGATK